MRVPGTLRRSFARRAPKAHEAAHTAPAERELAEIVSYLLNQTPAGAALFVDELERGLSRLLRHPFSAQQTDMPGVRRLSLRRFPYSVFHTVEVDEIVVLHIRHGHGARCRMTTKPSAPP